LVFNAKAFAMFLRRVSNGFTGKFGSRLGVLVAQRAYHQTVLS
jgi:hypothetical protein